MSQFVNNSMACWLLAIAIVLSGTSPNVSASEAAVVSVLTASGREFSGLLDPRTNDQSLWLRFERGSAYIQRAIAWTEVVSISDGDKTLTSDAARQLAARQTPPQSNQAPHRSSPPAAFTPPPPPSQSNIRPTNAIPRVRAISLDATPANWDADVEVDGLAVAIFPLDDLGRPIPATGTLELTAIGELPLGHPGDRNPLLGRISLPIRTDDFIARQGVYRLPFQALHPDFDTNLGQYGAVHAKLSVPGQGAFEATATIRVRPYSNFRDRLQQSSGGRFLAVERRGRSD